MSGDLKERFNVNVYGVAASVAEWSATNDTTYITGANVNIPARPAPTSYRITMGGKMSGANGAKSVGIRLGSTNVITIASDGNDAADWFAHFILIVTSPTAQKVIGQFIVESADPNADYAAGTVDLSAGATLTPFIVSAHASDTMYCEICTVEQGTP